MVHIKKKKKNFLKVDAFVSASQGKTRMKKEGDDKHRAKIQTSQRKGMLKKLHQEQKEWLTNTKHQENHKWKGKSRPCWQVMSSEKVAELTIFFNEVLSRSPREVGNDCDEELTRVWKKKKAKLSDTW